MTPRSLLDCAHRLAAGAEESDWRSAVSRGYYAAFHATAEFVRSLRFRVPADGAAHVYLTDRLFNAGSALWAQAGGSLHDLRRQRNLADYDLSASFGVVWADRLLIQIDDYFDLLDQLRGDADLLTVVAAIRAYEAGRGQVTYFGP